MGRWRNKEPWLAQLARIPAAMKAGVQARGDAEAGRLAAAIRQAAPVGGADDPHPGALRDSVHDARGQAPLKWRIVIDARDARGRFIFKPVEFGHMTAGGEHVPPVAFAYPTFRAQFPKTRRALAKAGRDAAREAAPLWFRGHNLAVG